MQTHKILNQLASRAIARLEALPQPVVRICGPLTSGGAGYEENLKRFERATSYLTEQGYTVFDYFADDDEEYLKELDIPWETIMEHYHKPILETELLTTAFFLPDWKSSRGASWEHDFIANNTDMNIEYLSDDVLTAT